MKKKSFYGFLKRKSVKKGLNISAKGKTIPPHFHRSLKKMPKNVPILAVFQEGFFPAISKQMST